MSIPLLEKGNEGQNIYHHHWRLSKSSRLALTIRSSTLGKTVHCSENRGKKDPLGKQKFSNICPQHCTDDGMIGAEDSIIEPGEGG